MGAFYDSELQYVYSYDTAGIEITGSSYQQQMLLCQSHTFKDYSNGSWPKGLVRQISSQFISQATVS